MKISQFRDLKFLLFAGILMYGPGHLSDPELVLNSNHSEDFFQAEPQRSESRSGLTELQSLKVLNLSAEHQLYRTGLFAATNQTLTVYDYQRVSFYQFDDGLNLTGNFGQEGRGPGEFINPTDLITDNSGNFWIVDGRTAKITKWSEKGVLVEEVSVSFGLIPHRYAIFNDDQFALFTLMGQSSIHVLNRDGKIQHSFLTVTGLDFSKKGLLLDGNITADDERVYYSGRRNDLIKAYSKDGKLIYSRKTINPIDRDLLNMTDRELRETSSSALDIEVYGNHLFILYGGAIDDPNRWRYLDVYNKSDGEYKHTFLLESSARKFTINERNDGDTRLAVSGYYENSEDRALSLYKLPEPLYE